jgi:hypothetical protein
MTWRPVGFIAATADAFAVGGNDLFDFASRTRELA